MVSTAELRKLAKCVNVAISDGQIADDVAYRLNSAADEIDRLRNELSALESARENYVYIPPPIRDR